MRHYVGLSPVTTGLLDLSDPIACARADAFVRLQEDATPFHLTGWSRAVERACGARAFYLVAEGADGILAVLPCHEIRSMLTGHAISSIGFAVGGGLLGDWMPLIGSMLSIALQTKATVAQVRGGSNLPGGWTIDEESYVSFSRPLASNDDDQLQSIPRKRRAEIRDAMTLGLDVRVGRSDRDLKEHFQVYSQSVRNLGTPVFPPALFREILNEFGENADILTISDNGRPLASVLSLYQDQKVYPYWGGGTAFARRCHANAFLYYSLMCHARSAKSCTEFDFGRSHRGSGAAAFKQGFGFSPVPLVYAQRVVRTSVHRDVKMAQNPFPLARACWRRLPLLVTNRLGPFIARGLG